MRDDTKPCAVPTKAVRAVAASHAWPAWGLPVAPVGETGSVVRATTAGRFGPVASSARWISGPWGICG